MPIELFWDDDTQTVMLCEFNGRWTWDELYRVLATTRRLSEERGRIFGAIIDVRKGSTVPGGTIFNRESLDRFRGIRQMAANGRGPVVVLGMNGLIKTIIDTVKSLDTSATNELFFADTMPEAQEIIYKVMSKKSNE